VTPDPDASPGLGEDERDDEQREVDSAAEEARRVGGVVEPLSDDPAKEPGEEAGEGESEGFEQAERRLEERPGLVDEGQLAIRDLKLIDGAMAGLAEAMGLTVTDYDTVSLR